jgi:hypothetical protein
MESQQMAESNLERRVASLERKVADLISSKKEDLRAKDWQRTIGMFAGDDVMKDIDAETARIRDEERRRVRRRLSKRRRAKA